MLISNQQMTNIIDNKYYWQQMELGLGLRLTYGVWGSDTHKHEREKEKTKWILFIVTVLGVAFWNYIDSANFAIGSMSIFARPVTCFDLR